MTPSGTTLRPTRPHRNKHRHRISKPLKVTPPLGQGAYVFPVVGVSGYGDSYGAFRGDVHGKWHSVHTPFPVHPRLPRNPRFRREARQVFRQLLVARHLIEQPTTPIEQPEVDRPARRSAPATPGLLALREEPAMPTVDAGNATPTVPLLFALLVIAVLVATLLLATMALGRILRDRVSEAS